MLICLCIAPILTDDPRRESTLNDVSEFRASLLTPHPRCQRKPRTTLKVVTEHSGSSVNPPGVGVWVKSLSPIDVRGLRIRDPRHPTAALPTASLRPSLRPRHPIGWHYLSNATCLIRPHLFYALFIVSRITIICQTKTHYCSE